MQKKTFFTIPNLLSFYRLITFPLLIAFIIARQEDLFTVFFCINLITDILDGLLARLLKQQTALGARLDSLADMGTFIAAFAGILCFKSAVMISELWLFWVFVTYFLMVQFYALVKFHKYPSLHLYSMKISGYIQGLFFFWLFAFDYVAAFFIVAMTAGFIAWTEELLVLIRLKKLRSDIKGLWWMNR